jgi:hypothetical protein
MPRIMYEGARSLTLVAYTSDDCNVGVYVGNIFVGFIRTAQALLIVEGRYPPDPFTDTQIREAKQ